MFTHSFGKGVGYSPPLSFFIYTSCCHSIQVYKGHCRDSGRELAVKMVRDLDEKVCMIDNKERGGGRKVEREREREIIPINKVN